MASFEAEFQKREEIAEGTMAFHFARPAGFEFKAGQSVNVGLVDPPETDAKGNRRSFSIVSAPYEQELVIATRMRDTAFKRVLRAMPKGTRVALRGPGGLFSMEEADSAPRVFLAGGIGITPFVSMLRQAAKERLARKLTLFYSNRRPEDAAFLDELIDEDVAFQQFHCRRVIRVHLRRNHARRHVFQPTLLTALRDMYTRSSFRLSAVSPRCIR